MATLPFFGSFTFNSAKVSGSSAKFSVYMVVIICTSTARGIDCDTDQMLDEKPLELVLRMTMRASPTFTFLASSLLEAPTACEPSSFKHMR
ncbi:hypothetical protein Mapa_006339 [Marchantia paleacea]|nr:hypothetical protein Mapa_006339 [Marchantia paleacea]